MTVNLMPPSVAGAKPREGRKGVLERCWRPQKALCLTSRKGRSTTSLLSIAARSHSRTHRHIDTSTCQRASAATVSERGGA